ncbi:MAG: TIGR00645 family protein [Gammaproteobacteria bacterium]|nr:TIGR00645 family protein [Gammaproteobacteria bacterium]
MYEQTPNNRNVSMNVMAQLIFMSRWLQAPLYLGLIVAQGVYVFLFIKELIHLVAEANTFNESQIMLLVLGLIDVVMIANLLIMVIIGGYETFVSRLNLKEHPDQPQWLAHVNATTMKIKLAMALIGISSIHLLKSFINADQMSTDTIYWQVAIHLTFIVSAIAMAITDFIMNKSIAVAHQHGH